jgi:hypothetical protein
LLSCLLGNVLYLLRFEVHLLGTKVA